MRRARTVLVLAPVVSLAMVLFGPEEEAETKEGEEADTNTLVCTINPCFDMEGKHTLLGTDYNEQIHALQGSDRASGLDGSDIIAGDDELQEERLLSAGPGSSTLTDGSDQIDAGPGNDGPVKGFGGSDVLLGGEGNDGLDAREFSRSPGRDFVDGGPGEDSITAEDGAIDEIYCGEGDDTVFGVDEGLDSVSSDCERVFPTGR
jgi:Ca2+-binding RTX toxin-like protein